SLDVCSSDLKHSMGIRLYVSFTQLEQEGNPMKKLKEKEATFIKDIIDENESVIEMDNKRYYVSLIEEPESIINDEIECKEFKEKVKKAKLNILKGKRFTIDDFVDLIEQGVL